MEKQKHRYRPEAFPGAIRYESSKVSPANESQTARESLYRDIEAAEESAEYSVVKTGFSPEQGSSDVSNERHILSGIERNLGLSQTLQSDQDLVTVIEAQLPVKAVSALIKNGLQEKEVYSLIIPRRTLQHRRSRKERLSVEESDRAVRVARIIALSEQVFGNKEKSMRWLRSTKQRFAGRTGMEMLATETGSRLVEEMLYQIDEGMAA